MQRKIPDKNEAEMMKAVLVWLKENRTEKYKTYLSSCEKYMELI